MIRESIIDLYRANGKPLSLERIASELSVSSDQLDAALAREENLNDLRGLSVGDARSLIEFYGTGRLFTQSIEEYVRVRERIEAFEAKARAKDS